MAFMDGAVNGMISRLLQVGFTPAEAFCLGQAAYIAEHKRSVKVPPTVVERQQATWEINQTIKLLAVNPFGPDAHRLRIILWETVFGFGSWHEPVDLGEIYAPSVPTVNESSVAQDSTAPGRQQTLREQHRSAVPKEVIKDIHAPLVPLAAFILLLLGVCNLVVAVMIVGGEGVPSASGQLAGSMLMVMIPASIICGLYLVDDRRSQNLTGQAVAAMFSGISLVAYVIAGTTTLGLPMQGPAYFGLLLSAGVLLLLAVSWARRS